MNAKTLPLQSFIRRSSKSCITYSALLLLLLSAVSCSHRNVRTTAARSSAEDVAEHAVLVGHLSKERVSIVQEAESWLGTPYLYAGQDKGVGTDCSGMVMQVYLLALKYPIPRNSAKQAEFCRRIRKEDAIAGDLVFFATGNDPKTVSHVGILLDDTRFIHASSSKGVTVTPLANPWWSKRLLMYGRIPLMDQLSEY